MFSDFPTIRRQIGNPFPLIPAPFPSFHPTFAPHSTDSTSGLLRLSPPAKDDFHLIRFTMEDILAVDFVSGEIYVQKVN